MAKTLDSLRAAIVKDPGLRAEVSDAQLNRGLKAADKLNAVLLKMIDKTNVNDDGLLTGGDMARIAKALSERENAALWVDFFRGHGNDNGEVETGYHYVQNDGGTLKFQGLSFLDTVADAIYHYGFDVKDGRYVNEDGASNETTADVAGWLNYFLNGHNVVFGSGNADELGSDVYSQQFAKARSETFYAGDGDDKIWAIEGNDRVYGGDGCDVSGGGRGNDRMYGESGRDTLWCDDGRDQIYGGTGDDELGGGKRSDQLFGGGGSDKIYGEDGSDRLDGGDDADDLMAGVGNDRVFGGAGLDRVNGDEGDDAVYGGAGGDTLSGGGGRDRLDGGRGVDTITMWDPEGAPKRDVIVFRSGDSGIAKGDRDLVEGFQTGTDIVDLRGLGTMQYRADEFRGDGKASFLFQVQKDGEFNELRIDTDGDRAADMIVVFHWAGDLTRGDFLFDG